VLEVYEEDFGIDEYEVLDEASRTAKKQLAWLEWMRLPCRTKVIAYLLRVTKDPRCVGERHEPNTEKARKKKEQE
jgi:hypothetical protein